MTDNPYQSEALTPSDSEIDALLTQQERRVFNGFKAHAATRRRAIRSSIRYAVGAGMITAGTILSGWVYWSLGIYAVILVLLFMQHVGGRAIIDSVAAILDKYDGRIRELEQKSQASEEPAKDR